MEIIMAMSDRELLERVIGKKETEKIYQGKLRPIFLAFGGTSAACRKLQAAHELVKRLLGEALEMRDAMSSPEAVRDYCRLSFLGREHEVFVTLFLDAQNRLIAAEELFRGTLTQTSVYPREIVKRA